MKIILSDEKGSVEQVGERYVVLELDTFIHKEKENTAYAVVDAGDIPLAELTQLKHFQEQHANLIKNYKLGNFKFVEDMIEHVKGKFGGSLDSFYTEMYVRVIGKESYPDNWDSKIIR
jgi:hypothetical protein|tara:strand:+ start:293 stop:646 length:354 start_codon:yes stop_codon:yes gene_type:complete